MKAVFVVLALLVITVMGRWHGHGSDRDDDSYEEEGHHGREHRRSEHRRKHYSKIVNACESDVSNFCGIDRDVARCFEDNAACFSSECIEAVNHVARHEKRHREHHREHHRHGVPETVKSACASDKSKLCGGLHGWEGRKCMRENLSQLSSGCTGAITAWLAIPTPPTSLVAVCEQDATTLCPGLEGLALYGCMKDNFSQVNADCQAGITSFVQGVRAARHSHDKTYATETETESGDAPAVVEKVAMGRHPSAPICDQPNTFITPEVSALVSKAYSPENQEGSYHHRHHGRFMANAVAAGAGVLVLAIAIVAIRRIRARRARREAAALPTAVPAAQVVMNPLSNTADGVPLYGNHYIVTGVPVNLS